MPWKECSVMDERLQFVAAPAGGRVHGETAPLAQDKRSCRTERTVQQIGTGWEYKIGVTLRNESAGWRFTDCVLYLLNSSRHC
jgi:hypothetical protein